MKKLLIAASLSLAVSAPAIAAGPQQGKFSFSLFGGLDTPVSLAIVPFAHSSNVPFMGVWAAGTPITRNGAADDSWRADSGRHRKIRLSQACAQTCCAV